MNRHAAAMGAIAAAVVLLTTGGRALAALSAIPTGPIWPRAG
jgi:hypothetical protein